ncbi:MAG: hypothetical protein JW810_11795, partial [Sedimentisphaerales bacterium]|nr:hypothetical protein [Sedimentisphaerales bacterium]
MQFAELLLELPDWIGQFLPEAQYRLPDRDQRMQLVVDLSRQNVERQTGGPFGAAVFEMATGQLIAVGVNRVEPLNCSLAHAEMMALAWAQRM